MSETYQHLMACPSGEDVFDRHVFACVIAKGAGERVPLTEAVGLDWPQLFRLMERYFPGAGWLFAHDLGGRGEDALEEPDLRCLLCDNASDPGRPETAWLAAMVARRSLKSGHLWQDLGITCRADLSRLMERHFAPLAARNSRDMKWKKFFYRELCQMEGVNLCKSPVCDSCTDFAHCFGPEEGEGHGTVAAVTLNS